MNSVHFSAFLYKYVSCKPETRGLRRFIKQQVVLHALPQKRQLFREVSDVASEILDLVQKPKL